MAAPPRILYCHCAHARVVPSEVKNAVLEQLSGSGVEFEAVPDLCEMAARGDPRLRECAADPSLKVAACYPRAVKWLFAAAGADLPDASTRVLNMRTQTADEVVEGLLGHDGDNGCATARPDPAAAQRLATTLDQAAQAGVTGKPWKPWFPVIDYTRCTNCMQCLSFCLFDVYGVSSDKKIQVQNQSNCKTDCPACSRVCPEVAIMFPKYKHGPINGDEVADDDVRREAMKVDISALLGGDVYALLRDRSAKAKSRFSKERDDERALKERQTCLITLQKELDVPAEVLAALPSLDDIRAKADAAHARAREASAAADAHREVGEIGEISQGDRGGKKDLSQGDQGDGGGRESLSQRDQGDREGQESLSEGGQGDEAQKSGLPSRTPKRTLPDLPVKRALPDLPDLPVKRTLPDLPV